MRPLSDELILAVDLGTSGPKVALVTSRGEVLDWEFEHVPLYLLPGGGAEQDANEWWTAIGKAMYRLLQRNAQSKSGIAALCCTSQWSGTVAIDASAQPLARAIIWMDARGAPYVRRITAGGIALQGYSILKLLYWVRLTGGAPSQSGKDSIAHILYLRHRAPELFHQAHKFLEPKDFLNLRFTGEYAASFDSIGLHWITDNRNLDQVKYSPRLLGYAGLDETRLPPLKRSIDILGEIRPVVADEFGLPRGVKVIVGSPDMQSAAIGSGAVEDGQAHLYIGTSSWLCCHTPKLKTDILHNIGTIPSAIPNRYLVLNEQECAGACLDYYLRQVLYPEELGGLEKIPEVYYQRANQQAGAAPAGSGRVIFAPWLYGERTPVDDHLARGAFFNLSLRTSQAHLTRAVFEGVAYNTRWLLTFVEKFVQRRLEQINFVGGGAQSDLWCQIHADVLQRTIHKMHQPILVNARGAAFIASVGMGWLTFADVPACVPVERTFIPQTEHVERYEQLYREFIRFYERNRAGYARLNRLVPRRADRKGRQHG